MESVAIGDLVSVVGTGPTVDGLVFDTPSPEGIYTFQSSAPGDGAVPALNDGQFILM